jgi:ATP-dependent DNA ligase
MDVHGGASMPYGTCSLEARVPIRFRHAEVIICGWKTGQGCRADTIGSLLLGVWDGNLLRYAGHVGTGFTQAALTD